MWKDVQRNEANGFQRVVQAGNQEAELRAENWGVTDALREPCRRKKGKEKNTNFTSCSLYF